MLPIRIYVAERLEHETTQVHLRVRQDKLRGVSDRRLHRNEIEVDASRLPTRTLFASVAPQPPLDLEQ